LHANNNVSNNSIKQDEMDLKLLTNENKDVNQINESTSEQNSNESHPHSNPKIAKLNFKFIPAAQTQNNSATKIECRWFTILSYFLIYLNNK
jgi:hypothetical protein